MSWHCLYCGETEKCNGLIELYDIRGGIPKRLCCHITCFAKSLPNNMNELKAEIKQWDEEFNEVPFGTEKRKQ